MQLDLNSHSNLTIAVSGLKTGDNPQPGVPIIRGIKKAGFEGKIIGLCYDALEAGIYLDDLADSVFLMPYPSGGSEAFLERIDFILSKTKIDIIIPTLDAEILTYIKLEKELEKRGIKTFLPSEEQFRLRDKSKLNTFFPPKGILVPETEFLTDEQQFNDLKINYPIFVKGSLYDAYQAFNQSEANKLFHYLKAKWGLPVIAQQKVIGEEYNIALVGDGRGHMLGMVPQKKLVITDKGKGFGGVVIKNQKLDDFAKKVVQELKWQGPCELEVIIDDNDEIYLIEINPRFPAWVGLAAGAGQNLPAMVVKLALGIEVNALTEYKPGVMFVRHSEDIISNISVMGSLSTNYYLEKKEITDHEKNL